MSRAFDPLVLLALLAGGGVSIVLDVRTRRIPNLLTAGVAATGLALAAGRLSNVAIVHALLGGLLGLALMAPGYLFRGTGAGDVKLFAAFGTLLGPGAIAMAFLYTAIAGGVLAVLVAARRGRLATTCRRTADLVVTAGGNAPEIEGPSSDNRFAFAPAIVCGALAAALGV